MTLSVKKTTEKGKISPEMKKINRYLDDFLDRVQTHGKIESYVDAVNHAADVNPEDFSLDAIKEARDGYKKQLKNYGLKEKMYYYAASNIDDAYLEDSNDKRGKTTAFVGISSAVAVGAFSGIAALSGSPDAAAGVKVAMSFLVGGTLGVPVVAMARNAVHDAFIPKTKEGKEKADEYVKVKHALLALKQLKKAVEAPAKAKAKEEYKQEVGKYMSMTNPGGMVSPIIAAKKGKLGR